MLGFFSESCCPTSVHSPEARPCWCSRERSGKAQSTSNKTLTLKKKSTEKWLGRTKQISLFLDYLTLTKICLLLNIYINTAIFELYSSLLFHKLTVVYLWLRTPSPLVGPTAQASSCPFLKAQSLQAWGTHLISRDVYHPGLSGVKHSFS